MTEEQQEAQRGQRQQAEEWQHTGIAEVASEMAREVCENVPRCK